jgi:hypothetical protein
VSYSRNLKLEKFEGLENVLSSLQALEPGGSCVVSCESSEDLVKTRYSLYEFLFHMELKGRFRLKVLSPTKLMIVRIGFKPLLGVSQFGVPVTKAPDLPKTMIERLIELWGEAEAKAQLEAWIEAKAISKEEGEELWEHVQRIMS